MRRARAVACRWAFWVERSATAASGCDGQQRSWRAREGREGLGSLVSALAAVERFLARDLLAAIL